METNIYEIDVEFVIQSDLATSSGFGIILMKYEPVYPWYTGPLNGVREDFNGAGVFLYQSRERKPGQWVNYCNLTSLVRGNSPQSWLDEDALARGSVASSHFLPH